MDYRKRKKRRKARRSLIIWLLIAGGTVALLSFLFWPLKSKKFRIVFDEAKIAYREAFLAEKIPTAELLSNPPNIILILADDLGKTDISLYGSPHVHTKNIDAIGQEGVTFNEAYISSPICSPSRAGLMTGRYQQRFGFELNIHERYPKNRLEYFVAKNFIANKGNFLFSSRKGVAMPSFEDMHKQGLPPTEFILPEILKKYGYQTACFGKWHLGYNKTAIPMNRGFDYHYGFLEAHSLYGYEDDPNIINQHHEDFTDKYIWGKGRKGNCAIYRNGAEVVEKQYLTNRIGEEASQWVKDNHRNGPFFMYVPFSAPHTPFQATKAYYDKYAHVTDRNKRVYYAMIHALDDAVGQITATVDSLGLAENTLIIFISDNGGASYTHATDNAPLKGGKFSNFEGGLNVPFMMRWKGEIPPASRYEAPVISFDIFTTVAYLAGAKLPDDRSFDGKNLMPYILGNKREETPHQALFWRSLYHKAVRKGKWKLIKDEKSGEMALYNLDEDKPERTNLITQCAEVLKELEADLAAWEAELINPNWPNVMDYKIVDGESVYYFPL